MTHCYELDGLQMQTPEQAHAYLKNQLAFPEYYGMNLDALFDCLTAYAEDAIFWIGNAECIHPAIMRVFEQASEKSGFLIAFTE